jgi:hypothetical protein
MLRACFKQAQLIAASTHLLLGSPGRLHNWIRGRGFPLLFMHARTYGMLELFSCTTIPAAAQPYTVGPVVEVGVGDARSDM